MRSLLLMVLLFCANTTAQTVRFANFGTDYDGWLYTTVDKKPPHQTGRVGDTIYVLGDKIGADYWGIDIKTKLRAGEEKSLKLDESQAYDWQFSYPISDPGQWFGGKLKIADQELNWVSLKVDGAAFSAHLRTRVQQTFVVDTFLRWYPDQPAWATGEVVVTSSNPTLTTTPNETILPNFKLEFGDAFISILGRGLSLPGQHIPLIEPGTRFCDGQRRAIPLGFVWWRHVQPEHWSSAGTAVNYRLSAVGINQLLPMGNPSFPAGYSGRQFVLSTLGEAIRKLHTWENGVVGPNTNSGDTGEQEEQLFPRGEVFLPDGLGSEMVAKYAGMHIMGRPCHFCDASGAPIRWQDHPNCTTWDGRPHWHLAVSADRLGAENITGEDRTFNGVVWGGPDREHWMYSTVCAGARLTGSRALQMELSSQSTLILLGETVQSMKPNWSTNGPGAARAVGYMGLLVTYLDQNMEDRVLAASVVQRWNMRCDQTYLPYLENPNLPSGVWDVRYDDPRLGPGGRWMPWQVALGAYGHYTAAVRFNRPTVRQQALRAAKAVLRDAYVKQGASLTDEPEPKRLAPGTVLLEQVIMKDGLPDSMPDIYSKMQVALQTDSVGVDSIPAGQWSSKDVVALDGAQVTVGYFDMFGTPLAAAVVLMEEPWNVQAREIWTQFLARATLPKYRRWAAPGVPISRALSRSIRSIYLTAA